VINQKKIFTGGMNGDDSPKLVGENETLNVMNARVSVSEFGRDGRIENVPGTTLINQSVFPPYGTNQTIGSAVDYARNRIIYFHSNTVDDSGIYCFDIDSGITYAVLYDSQVIGGLGFDRDFRIDRNARVVGDLLYWLDEDNQPRRMNIEAGIKMNHASYVTDVEPYDYPMDFEVITLIRKPPVYPLTYEKQTNVSVNSNLIKNNAFRFCYYFYYRDGEISTLSPQSLIAPFNTVDETFNQIEITVPLAELISQDVQSVNLVVLYANGEKAFTVKTWDKNNATDLAEINAHNAGTTALSFLFTNDSVGEALSDAYRVKPFDTIPLTSKTLEYAQNRLFLGNNLLGYDTPTISSLQLTVLSDTSGGSGTGAFVSFYADYYLSIDGAPQTGPFTSGNYTVVELTSPVVVGSTIYAAGYYFLLPVPDPLPASIDISTYIYIGADDASLLAWVATYELSPINGYNPSTKNDTGIINRFGNTSVAITGSEVILSTVLKSDAAYEVSIVFYDEFLRSCGVIKLNNKVTTPDRDYDTATFDYAIQWSLSNFNAVNEIPDWAKYYSIVATKNFRTNFFIQARAGSIVYATKDSVGEYVFTSTTYASTNAGVALKLDKLTGYGIGYTFSEGDVCKVYLNGSSTVYSLSILAQDGEWIVCELKNLGSLAAAQAFFEIYTPKIQSADSVYYEISQMYLVANYGTASRAYTTLLGQIVGDVYLVDRNDGSLYRNEAMSPNDTLWQFWFTSFGRPQFIDRIGQQRKTTSIKWSNTFLPGTITNGLSSFDALDEKILPIEMGDLNKLQLAEKVSEEGKIMLAICRRETASLYLGEVQLVGSSSNAFVASSPSVIGTINILQGSFGTINPETVVEYLGLVFWVDALNGVVVQYSSNGLFPVSQYKQARFFKRYCTNYLQANNNDLDNINGFHHIPAGIDPFHKEYLITLPALIYENYAEVLPSYGGIVPDYATSILNRFDIYDKLGKTMAFSFQENHWGSNYEFMPEMMEYCQNIMYGWRNGNMYQFNSNTTNWNTFFGVEYPVRVCVVGNPPPSVVKDVYDIAIEGSNAPDYTVLYTELPNEQISDLIVTDYTNQENIFYARFFRDRLSPNATGTAAERLYKGDVLKSITPYIMMEFQQYDGLIFIDFVDIGYAYSRGQLKIAE